MKKLLNIARTFREEESGAAMIEYSILIGIISVSSIAVVVAIGTWVTAQFTDLCDAMVGVSTTDCAVVGGGGGGGGTPDPLDP